MDLATLLPILVKASILLMVLGIGMNASWRDAPYLFRHPSLLIRSVLSMNVIMPFVAAGLAVTFNLPMTVKVALVALAVSPVPPILPKKELKAGGDAPYAVGLLVAIAALAIVTVPIAVSWFSSVFNRSGEIAPMTVAKVVFGSVLAPLAAGMAVRAWLPALAAKISGHLVSLGNALLMVSLVPLLYASWSGVHALFGNGTVAVIAAMVVIGLVLGHTLGGPRPDDRTVLALSTASRHPAVALAVAVASGEETKAMLAAILLYLIVATLVSIPYVMWRRRQAAAVSTRQS